MTAAALSRTRITRGRSWAGQPFKGPWEAPLTEASIGSRAESGVELSRAEPRAERSNRRAWPVSRLQINHWQARSNSRGAQLGAARSEVRWRGRPARLRGLGELGRRPSSLNPADRVAGTAAGLGEPPRLSAKG